MANADIKWIDGLPPVSERKSNMTRILPELLANPGRWAEVQRYPHSTGTSRLHSRAMQYCKAHQEVEYAVRRDDTVVGGEYVLYMRVKP